MKHAFRIVLAVGAVVAFVACSSSTDPDDGDACHDGDRIQCGCGERLSACINGRFAACDCAPVPFEARFGTFLGRCDAASDCPEGGTCFEYGVKGKRCTTTCTESTMCAAPSPKCNPKGVCAVPD